MNEKIQQILKKKEIDPRKKNDLEKNDFLALSLAAISVFLPVILGFLAFIALVTFLFLAYFS